MRVLRAHPAAAPAGHPSLLVSPAGLDTDDETNRLSLARARQVISPLQFALSLCATSATRLSRASALTDRNASLGVDRDSTRSQSQGDRARRIEALAPLRAAGAFENRTPRPNKQVKVIAKSKGKTPASSACHENSSSLAAIRSRVRTLRASLARSVCEDLIASERGHLSSPTTASEPGTQSSQGKQSSHLSLDLRWGLLGSG